MTDFYRDGFDDGYGRDKIGQREWPCNDGDDYSYRLGLEDGARRRRISDELESEGY